MERDALDAAARLLEREACALNEIERFRIPELHRVRIRALLDRIAVLEAERNALADEVYRLVDGLDEFWVQQPENARPAAIAAILCETARRAIELLQRWHDQDVSSEDYEQMIADFLAQVTKEP